MHKDTTPQQAISTVEKKDIPQQAKGPSSKKLEPIKASNADNEEWASF